MKNDFLREILSNIKNVNILEEIDDPQNVFEYLELATQVKQNINKRKILQQKDRLFDKELSDDERKKLLISLASVDEPEALRVLENFMQTSLADSIKDFVRIALQESTALLQSSLLGEPSILITSALGGKNKRLRYFIVLFPRKNKAFDKTQKLIIEKEISFTAENTNSIVEKIEIYDYFVILLMLIPYTLSPSQVIESMTENINYFGNFLNDRYILRNDKILSHNDVAKVIDNILQGKISDDNIDAFLKNRNISNTDENL